MTFWSLSALIWFKNMKKMLLQMTSGFLQLESTLLTLIQDGNHDDKVRITFFFNCPSLSVNSKKNNCNPYFIVIMITVLIMNVIFRVVNFKTQNYFFISTTQNVCLRLSRYDCSNFVHSCRIFGISELQTV
jgi:hypothetical protein